MHVGLDVGSVVEKIDGAIILPAQVGRVEFKLLLKYGAFESCGS